MNSIDSIIVILVVSFLQVDHLKCQPIFAKETTKLLDQLLSNYNKYSRPDSMNEPTRVHINLQIKDVHYDRKEMMFTLNCVFNQWWLDPRLSYWNFFVEEKNRTYLPFDPVELTHKLSSIKLPDQYAIWRPGTYIVNASPTTKETAQSRKLIRLYLDGRVLYSTRIMFRFKCQMDWSKFPHDKQRCPLHFASFIYSDKEIAYKWKDKDGCGLASNVNLPQLRLIRIACLNKSKKLSQLWIDSKKYRSSISLEFYFKRNTGVFLLEVYLPCVFLVIISWVSFLINREATNARIIIGSMTTLSMIILSFENRLLVKSVPYFTAIDYFVMISFAFIFASILEYIFVHHHTKLAYGDINTFLNSIPIDRLAKLIYSSLQPKDQITQTKDASPTSNKDELITVVRLNNEPMIYDLPITDNNKDEILVNNLLLNNQILNNNLLSLNMNNNLPNYSTFPRANHSSTLYQPDAYNTTDHLNESPLIESLRNLNTNNNYSSRTLTLTKRKLASIPEETDQQEPKNQLVDNLKLLRQKQEQQLEEQNNIDTKSKDANGNRVSKKLGYKINDRVRSILKFLSDHNSNSQLDGNSIDQLNSISKIDQICRILFPVLYALFILSYYIIFVF